MCMRKDIKEVVHLMKLNDEKINCAAIARQYDCDYRTVQKYYNERDSQKDKKKRMPRKVKKKIDGYEAIIEDKYLKHNSPAIAIYNLLKDKYGYTGSYTTIKYYCQNLKVRKQDEVTVHFETERGKQCQIDWKEDLTLVSRLGEAFTVNIFLAILGYSRLKYIELTFDRSQSTLFKCLTNTIKYFGGVPKEFLFDNMKTVVDQSRTQYSKPVYNDKFYQFSKDAGFEVKSCLAYKPKTKGKVETVAKVMNRLKVMNNEFDSIEELINIVMKLNEDINSEIQSTTKEKPFVRFEKEKEYLLPLPRLDILGTYYSEKVLTRKVPKDCLITYDGHKYSLPPAYTGKTVTLERQDDNLNIYYNKTLIQSHRITDKQITYNPDDYKSLLKHNMIHEENIGRICEDNLKIFDKL